MSAHFSADYVWLVVSSPASFQIDFAKCKALGITGLYYVRNPEKLTRVGSETPLTLR